MELDKIYCQDCLEGMRAIPDGSIDLIVTDPPYEFPRTEGKGVYGKNREYYKEIKHLSKGISNEHLEEMLRVCKRPNIYIWCNKNQIRQYLDFFEDAGCTMDLLTWHKTNPIPTCNNKYLSDTEYLLFFRKNVKLYGTYETKKKYWLTSLNTEDKVLYNHPTVKPLEIIKTVITNSSTGGDLVLDPFMGSGTTAVACKELGRHYIGYEISQGYVDTANRRLENISQSIPSALLRRKVTLEDFV